MVHSGQPNGHQSVPPSLLRSNPNMAGPQGGSLPSLTSFSSVSPHSQFNNMNMLGNVPNVPSLLNQTFVNGGPTDGQRVVDLGNGMSFNASSSSFVPENMVPGPSHVQGQQFSNSNGNQLIPLDQKQKQIDVQTFQQSQQQFDSVRSGLDGLGPVKAEPLVPTSDQHGTSQQQVQQMRTLSQVKFEQQQLQSTSSLSSGKLEASLSEQSLYLQQHHQQQFLNMLKQNNQSASAAQINMLQQQRMMVQQQQQQQQQQFLKGMPMQRPMRAPAKSYEAGLCARRVSHYIYQQQHRPKDNNIDFWRRFVNEYFAPNAKKKWCVSLYGTTRHAPGVFPQELWHCEICQRRPGRGFEATYEVLPRLFKIKYESGVLEELLYVDMPREYQNASGQIVLEYVKAIQETVFDTLRVARDGQLRIIFSPDLKIISWEFCSTQHEELLPRRLLIPQVTQLGIAAQKYTSDSQNASTLTVAESQSNCQMFLQSARQVAKCIEASMVNDLGYTKRYVRCLQIAEVVNSMKDLIDFSRLTGAGPMESLAKFPRRSGGFCGEFSQQGEQQRQQTEGQSRNCDHSSGQSSVIQVAADQSVPSVNSSHNTTGASTSAAAVTRMPLQNSINLRQQSSMSNGNSPYDGNSIDPSPASSSTTRPSQPNASSFQSSTSSLSNNLPQTSQGVDNHMSSTTSPANIPIQQLSLSVEVDHSESQASVQRMINEMMSNQFNRGGLTGLPSIGNDIRNVNGVLTGNNAILNGGNGLMGNRAVDGPGFSSTGSGLTQAAMMNGMRAALGMGNRSMINGHTGIPQMFPDQIVNHQQQDLGNQHLSELRAVNRFNNLEFDWKTNP